MIVTVRTIKSWVRKNIWQIVHAVILILIVIATTWLVIYIHTPRPQDFIFDFTSLNSTTPTLPDVNNTNKVDLENKISDAIRNSHRLGKLSDVYISVMSFNVSIRNHTVGQLSSPQNGASQQVFLNLQCFYPQDQQILKTLFPYGSSQKVTDNFQLSDPPGGLVDEVASHIRPCFGLDLSFRKEGELVEAKNGAKFSAVFSVDTLTCLIIFLFNFLILLGLLPLLREGWRFFEKGFKYFQSV